MDDQLTLDGQPAPAPRRRGRPTTAEEAALNGRAGKVTDAWAQTQAAGLCPPSRRTSVHQLVKRVLAAGQFDDDAMQAALLRLAGRGIAPTAAALGRELTHPDSPNGHNGNGTRRRYTDPEPTAYRSRFGD